MFIEFILKAGAILYVVASELGEFTHLTTFEKMNIFWLVAILIWLGAVMSLSLIFIFRVMFFLIGRFTKLIRRKGFKA